MISRLSDGIAAYGVIASADGRSPRTIAWVKDSARFFAEFNGGDIAISAIIPHEVRRWVSAMRQRPKWAGRASMPHKDNLSATSINNYVRGLKLLMSTLAREELIPSDPLAKFAAPKTPKLVIQPYSDPELKSIFQALGTTGYPLRNRALVGLLFDPGLRMSEAVGLRMGDVNLPNRQIVVLGKGQKQRLVPLGNWGTRQILSYTARERPQEQSPHLFIGSDGSPVTVHSIQQLLRRISRKVGFRVHAHRFRHSGAIRYLRNGGDSLYLQQLLGHSSLAMTQRYALVAGADLVEAHKVFSPGDRLRL